MIFSLQLCRNDPHWYIDPGKASSFYTDLPLTSIISETSKKIFELTRRKDPWITKKKIPLFILIRRFVE
jgi:hypothetical protein